MSVLSRTVSILFLMAGIPALGAERYWEVRYAASTTPGELQMGVTYTLWLPDNPAPLRALIVHQHGCGVGACQGGATAAYDLHWQALARKWNCGLLGPSYQQAEKQNCRLWCDPRNGSRKTFLKALDELGAQSRHPELARVPWCLWGHSGGGFWASLMQTLDPQRIVAIWCRSGTAFAYWEKGEIERPEIPDTVYGIPVVCNPGAKENGDKRFRAAWDGAWAMFQAYRAKGAPIAFAPDPRTAHECGDSRYLAIPFFDACLALRLPLPGAPCDALRPIDLRSGWRAAPLDNSPTPADKYPGKAEEAVWLPNARVAAAWSEYVQNGYVVDTTPPLAPHDVRAVREADRQVTITWRAEADLESGLQAFLVERDALPLGQTPENPKPRFGKPLFQAMSYHDTPEKPLPEMRYIDTSPQPGQKHVYRVIAINTSALRSPPSPSATLP